MVVASCAVVVAGVLSIGLDVHAMWTVRSAPSSDLEIRIIRRGDWWQLDYARGPLFVTSANELHLPAAERVTLAYSGKTPLRIPNTICLPRGANRCVVVAAVPARFLRRDLPIVVQSRADFDRWLANEVRPANVSPIAASMFRNDGCAYCHVIRGVVNEPSTVAPDLTHFASRATIAASGLPNRRGQLTGWVVHSRGVKPKSEMPDNAMRPAALHAVVSLLESLH